MGDISIPGVSSRYNTQKLIQDLVEVERRKLTRLEGQKTELVELRTLWQALSRRMQSVRDAARSLYGFESPFANRIGETTQERAVTVNPNRSAPEGEWRIRVIQTATADRFLSAELPLDATAPAGEYRFRVGQEEAAISFRGGRLSALVEAINQRTRGLLRAALIRVSPDRQVLSLEATKTGEANRLELQGAARELAVQTGMARAQPAGERMLAITPQTVGRGVGGEGVSLEEGRLQLPPGGRASLAAGVAVRPGLVLELRVQAERLSESQAPPPPPGLSLESPGLAEFQGVQIRSNPLRTGLPRFEPPAPAAPINDPRVGRAVLGQGQLDLPPFPLESTEAVIRLPFDREDQLRSLELENRNTHMRYTLTSVRVYDPAERGDLAPLRAQSTARDAVFELDGVRITRPSNTVDDVIPAATINLLDPTEGTATIRIKPDFTSIKDGIISFVGQYNRLMLELLALTSRNEAVLNEVSYLSDQEREELRKNLGRMIGDTSLNQLRSSLQRIMMESVPTGQPITLLSQVGISTNVGRSQGGAVDASRLRGYLEIDETRLDRALRENLAAVRALFGVDTNGDLVVDHGVAFRTDEVLRPQVQTGGLIATRVGTLDSQISRQDQEIQQFQDYLRRYEQDLRRRYGQMEGALNRLEETGRAIDNFSRQNSRGNR